MTSTDDQKAVYTVKDPNSTQARLSYTVRGREVTLDQVHGGEYFLREGKLYQRVRVEMTSPVELLNGAICVLDCKSGDLYNWDNNPPVDLVSVKAVVSYVMR